MPNSTARFLLLRLMYLLYSNNDRDLNEQIKLGIVMKIEIKE